MKIDKFSMAKGWMMQDDASPEEAKATWDFLEKEFEDNRNNQLMASAETDAIIQSINDKFGPGTMFPASEAPQPPMTDTQRIMEWEERNRYSDGQLVTPSADGSRPGYAGEKETATYKYEDSRLRYNKKTKKWEMIAGKEQELYIQEPGETKPQFKKRVKKVGIDRREKAHSLQSKQTKTSQNYINNWTKNWLDNNLKNYGVRDFDKAMKVMGKEWQANIKNLDLPKGTLKSLSRGEFNLPNVSTGRVEVHGKKPFTYEGFNLHTMFENPKEPGKYMAQWRKMFMKNKIRTTPGLKKDILEYFKFINKDKRGKVWRQEGTVKAFKDIMNKDVLYLMSPDSGITGHSKESLFNSFDDVFNKEYNKYIKKVNLGSGWKEAAAKIEKKLGYERGHILKSMSKERTALQKLFNLKELPHELRYSLEHGQGIAAAAKTNDKAIMKRAVDDLIGTTVRQNQALGWGGFEATRNALMRDIMAGNNVADNIKSLNQLARNAYKEFGLKGNMYSIKDGQLTSKPITTALTQEERFKQYFKEIDRTKEGSAAIKKQYGSLENLNKEISNYITGKSNKRPMLSSGFAGAFEQLMDEPMMKALTNSAQFKKFANFARGTTKYFGPIDLLIGFADYENELSKYKKADGTYMEGAEKAAAKQALQTMSLGLWKGGDREKIARIKDTFIANGGDENVFDAAVAINENQNKINNAMDSAKENYLKNKETEKEFGVPGGAQAIKFNLDMPTATQQMESDVASIKRLATNHIDLTNKYVDVMGKDITIEQFKEPFSDIKQAGLDTAKKRWQENYRSIYDKPTGTLGTGDIGEQLTTHLFTTKAPERAEEKRLIEDMKAFNPSELYRYNKEFRNLTRDNPEANVELLMGEILSKPSIYGRHQDFEFKSTGGRTGSYFDGGIASLRRKK